MIRVPGGITAPHGFKAAGAHVGLKRKRKDLAVVYSETPAKVAAVFTTNIVKAAPILWNQSVLASRKEIHGFVVNSGNANSCTGSNGIEHTKTMAETAAQALSVQPEQILIASTGVIGVPLPIETVKSGIISTTPQLSTDHSAGTNAAQAIMTTDSFVKEIAMKIDIGGCPVTIGAMAKGSGMIHPNMATMLAFITTDINISKELLQKALKTSVAKTYNMITVDGDTSTNDMSAILANGLAGNTLIDIESDDYTTFSKALDTVNTFLAKAIAQDGEGATKLLEVTVHGARTEEDAQKLSKSVVSSSLVKTAFFGEDANWGRVLAALGYGGVLFNPDKVSIDFSSGGAQLCLMKEGTPSDFDEVSAADILKEKNIQILIDVDDGKCAATAWGCDLSYDYVRINGSNRT